MWAEIMSARVARGGVWALTNYEVRPHACASIFHASTRFENV